VGVRGGWWWGGGSGPERYGVHKNSREISLNSSEFTEGEGRGRKNSNSKTPLGCYYYYWIQEHMRVTPSV